MQVIEYLIYNILLFGGIYCFAKALECMVQHAIDEYLYHSWAQDEMKSTEKEVS